MNLLNHNFHDTPGEPIKGQDAPGIGLFLRQKKNGEPMTIVGDALQSRDFTYVKDVVAANIAASKLDCKNEISKFTGRFG